MENTQLVVKLANPKVDFERLMESRHLFGSNILFEEDTWFCDKKIKSASDGLNRVTIYFSTISSSYRTLAKYYVLFKLNERLGVGTVKNHLKSLVIFFHFLESLEVDLKQVNKEIALKFKQHLVENNYEDTYRHTLWSGLSVVCDTLQKWGYIKKNYFSGENPFPKEKNHAEKYIPYHVVEQLDKIFQKDNIPLYMRAFYWIARSVPSRISEVLGMSLDCIKPYEDDWVIFMPTWKQNGGYKQAQIRRIYLKYEGHGKFLIDLIKQQQKESSSIQDQLPFNERGLLFTHHEHRFHSSHFKKTGEVQYLERKKVLVENPDQMRYSIQRICERYKVTEEDGGIYHLTTHQLRHNGITDRLYAGFTPIQIALMTDHQTHAMITTAYNHMQKEKLVEKQRLVHEEKEVKKTGEHKEDEAKKPVYFKGRILNMDDALEKRLLKNIRSHKLNKLGICSDITGCESKLFECFDCDFFVPDADQLGYFEEQVSIFEEKLEKFKDHVYLRENAEYNLVLHQKIVERIKKSLAKEQ